MFLEKIENFIFRSVSKKLSKYRIIYQTISSILKYTDLSLKHVMCNEYFEYK